jgi:hypothetical protein
MTDNDKPAFVSAIKRLFAGWNQTPTTEQLASWWVALRDLPWPRVSTAMTATLRTASGTYPPVPAVVRKAVHAAADDGYLPDGARHAPGCPGGCGWVTIEQRHPEAGTGCYTPDATRTRAVRGCREEAGTCG